MIKKNKNIGLLTFGLYSGREHLMPWRLFLEVSNYFQLNSKNSFLIINVSEEKYNNLSNVISVSPDEYNVEFMNNIINKYSIDLIFVPLSWRLKNAHVRIYRHCKCKVVGYVSGSYYSIKKLLPNFLCLELRQSYLYLLEALFPNWLFSFKLKKSNITDILCFNPETRKEIKTNLGSDFNYYDIFPGKDSISITPEKSEKYFLYFGSTAPIRGLFFLLKSFHVFRKKNKDFKLKCLIRKDRFRVDNKNKKYEGVEIITKNLTRAEFFKYISNCYAVVLPFLIVPSEIPLSFWEVMQLQKPIITIPNGTVSSLLKDTVYVSKKVNINSLSSVLYKTIENDGIENNCILKKQNDFIAKIPNWEEVGEQWEELVNDLVVVQ